MTAVVVVSPYRVNHEGKAYRGGETVEVPDDVAKAWIASGWASEPKPTTPRRPGTKRKTSG